MEDLRKKFEAKLPALVYALADCKEVKGIEYFHFNQAYFLEGFDFEHFKNMVKKMQLSWILGCSTDLADRFVITELVFA